MSEPIAPAKQKLKLHTGSRSGSRAGTAPEAAETWPVLVVDDDPQIHAMTRVLLRDYSFQGRGFQVVEAHSAAEARDLLAARSDIPVMLLDVVMETDDAGLSLARHIREDLGNQRLRIILRTGQPGQAPERDVMLAYDINDYRAKTELTAQKLFTAVVAALRSWIQIDTIERLNATLEARVEERTRELAESRAFAETLVEMLPHPVWYKDSEGRFQLHNLAFRNFFGIGEAGWHGRTAAEALGPHMPPEDAETDRRLLAGETKRLEFETQLADVQGRVRALMVTKGLMIPPSGPPAGTIGVVTDITERKALEQELRRLAITDPLTGCANRRHFMQAGTHENERAGRYGSPLSVVMLDIDHFKTINDSHGHAIGDEALRRVVDAVQKALREVDLLGRLGGEEFAVLLPETALDAALAVAERLRRSIGDIVVPLAAGALRVTASMGVAERGAGEPGFESLLAKADHALYRAKQAGRDRVEAA